MKSYTDLEQSKNLLKILPIESADMLYVYDRHLDKLYGDTPYVIGYKILSENVDIPCWSLAALLDVLPYPSLHKTYRAWRCDTYNEEGKVLQIGEEADNPVDSCVEMILKLNELNLL